MNAETFGKLFSGNGTVVFRVSDGADCGIQKGMVDIWETDAI